MKTNILQIFIISFYAYNLVESQGFINGIWNAVKKRIYKPLPETPQQINSTTVHNLSDYVPKFCHKPKLFFLKTHKTASSTVFNIFARYVKNRKLELACPNTTFSHFSWPQYFNKTFMYENTNPDVLLSHTRYNGKVIEQLFPRNKTLYVTILRNPVHQWLSGFIYFDFFRRFAINTKEDLINFLEKGTIQKIYSQEIQKFRTFNLLMNPTLFDMGVDVSKFRNMSALKTIIDEIEKRFDVVLFTDFFDESLVMLKEMYCLRDEDIIYFRQNDFISEHSQKFYSYLNDTRLVKAIKYLNKGDMMLYQRMLQKYKPYLDLFKPETEKLKKNIQKKYDECVSKRILSFAYEHVKTKGYELRKNLTEYQHENCKFMVINEVDFLKYFCKQKEDK